MGITILVNHNLRLWTLMAAISVLNACGQDRNLNEYRNSQVELELNKYRAIQGTYRGLAYQKHSKKPLGSIEVQLFANTVVDSDARHREARPVLQSYVTLRIPGLDEMVISMDSGFFLPQEQQFKTSMRAIRSGHSRTLQVEGNIKGSSFEGSLSVFGYPNTALNIELHRGLEWPNLSPSEYAKDQLPYITTPNELSYTGTAFYADGHKLKAALRLFNNSVNTTEALIDILSPVRIFTGIIDAFDSIGGKKYVQRYTFSSMTWDNDSRTLTGILPRGGAQSVELRTECAEDITSSTQVWNCSYSSSLGGILSEYKFERNLDYKTSDSQKSTLAVK